MITDPTADRRRIADQMQGRLSRKGDIAAWPRPHLIFSLSDVLFAGFKGGNDGVEFLDILAGSGFQFCGYIDRIAKLARARAKFSEVAYRSRPSFFAPINFFIKNTHGHFRFVVLAAKHVCPPKRSDISV
jgi:hypothetical protein